MEEWDDWLEFNSHIAEANLESTNQLKIALEHLVASQSELKDAAYIVLDYYHINRREKLVEMNRSEDRGKNAVYFPEIKPPPTVQSDNSFGIYWRDYSNVAVKRKLAKIKGIEFDRKNSHGTHVPNLKKGYTARCFKKAPAWELEMILKAEEEFKKIRCQTKELAVAGKAIRKVLKLLENDDINKNSLE